MNHKIDFDLINNQVDIISHIQKFESLKKEGDRYSGSHNHASEGGRCLQVTPTGQLWHCFSCESGGKVVEYEKDRLNCDYATAIESLADQYAINIPGQTPEQQGVRRIEMSQRKPVQELMLEAFKLYHENMTYIMRT
jgi:DNA primase